MESSRIVQKGGERCELLVFFGIIRKHVGMRYFGLILDVK